MEITDDIIKKIEKTVSDTKMSKKESIKKVDSGLIERKRTQNRKPL
jgi:hypothetical protein